MDQTLAAFEAELKKGTRLLSRRDPIIRALAKAHGLPRFRPHEDYFGSLVDAVISQQISSKAADSILRKLKSALGDTFAPHLLADAPDEIIRGSGVSPQKLGYLRSLVSHVTEGPLRLDELSLLPNDEIFKMLTAVKGIGVWTAQMFLIFTLGRMDVLPTLDLGVRKGVQVAYGLPELPKPSEVEEIAREKKWNPYCSIATWYMWRALEPVPATQ